VVIEAIPGILPELLSTIEHDCVFIIYDSALITFLNLFWR
jgi:hypothetical protein